jgi:DNA-binding FadR family transcriptional regulator
VLQDLLERLSTHLAHAPKSTLSTEDRRDAALNEHERLVRAVEDQDEQTARTIAREHTEAAGRAASSNRPSCGRHRPGASSGAVRGLGIDESVGAS